MKHGVLNGLLPAARALALGGLLLAQVARAQAELPPRPRPPLPVPTPSDPPAEYERRDLRTFSPDLLRENAWAAYEDKAWAVGAQLQHWAVKADGSGRYNLACFQARAGALEAAIYWLQQAALEEGVDASWAGEDQDLESLRRDPRWGRLAGFLRDMTAWWAACGRQETLVRLPSGHASGSPLGGLVCLHGRESGPRDFHAAARWQRLADQLGVAIVAVSGTVPTGRDSYVWAEDPARDLPRLEQALREVAARCPLDPARTVLLGFSQGGQVALELTARHPELFAGALAFSPAGAAALDQLPDAGARLAGRRFLISVGADEQAAVVTRATRDRDELRRLGAEVRHEAVSGQSRHDLPAAFEDRLGEWFGFACQAREPQ